MLADAITNNAASPPVHFADASKIAMIELNAVTKSFPVSATQTSYALRSVTMKVMAGEYVTILGKSGSGKSTLLNLVAGLDRPSSGTVRVAGTLLADQSESALARWRGRQVGVVFQFFQLLPTLTVLENIILAMELAAAVPVSRRRSLALDLLARVNLAEHANKLPSMLSGGQQQRAAIARALANDPPIVVADEPTGNLDTETAHDINGLFQQLIMEGKTLFIVTHDTNIAHAAYRVIELKDGLVVSDSAPQTARQTPPNAAQPSAHL